MRGPSDTIGTTGHTASFIEMIFPDKANHYGTLFGGEALSLMSKAAFVAAVRRARGPVVMARSERISFHSPVAVGELVELTASVTRVGHSSMTVAVDMEAETPSTGARRRVVSGSFEMVATDGDGRPIPVPVFGRTPSEEEALS